MDSPEYISELEGTEFPVLPDGSYACELMQIELITTKFGPAYRWHWRVPGADEDGGDFALTDITSTLLTPRSRANLIVKALRGSILPRSEKLKLDELPRRAQLVVTVNEESGFNDVVKVLPPIRPQPETAASSPVSDVDVAAYLAAKTAEAAGDEPPLPEPPTDLAATAEAAV
jgi:hypothetical protein